MRALTVKALLLNLQAKTRSGASVEAHYDIGNDLYTRCSTRAWSTPARTGRTRRRSPRRRRPSSISSCRKVGLEPGMRVLDLGCGWGGFASWAAEKYGCTVLGVTLSKEQVALGNELWKHLPVDLRLCDYRDVQRHVRPRRRRSA